MYTGLNLDERSEEEKAKDYKQQEILASAQPVIWQEREPREFPVFNQGFTFTCVANAVAKLLGISLWLKDKTFAVFSRSHIYQRRSNKPSAGMNGGDAFNIAKQGVTL